MCQVYKDVYIRKLNENELGFKDGEVGKVRGPAILVSKKLIGFFPPTSESILNHRHYISICTEGSNKSILLSYIYFNSKRVYSQKNGRDERRIYISKEHYSFFNPKDLFLFYKIRREDDVLFFVRRVSEKQNVYEELSSLLENNDLKLDNKGGHFIAPLELVNEIIGSVEVDNELEETVDETTIKHLEETDLEYQEEDKGVVNKTRPRPRIDLEEDDDLELFENSSFRKLVLFFYGGKCAISDNNIKFKNKLNLEAAHIKWHSEGGSSHPTNGIPLCRDLHWAFDRGMFTFEKEDSNYRIVVHKEMLNNPYLSAFNGKYLKTPYDNRYCPKEEYMEWHKNNIFGAFVN